MRTLPRRFGTAALIVIGTWLIAGCGMAPAVAPSTPPTVPAAQTAPTLQPTVITDAANGTAVRVRAGQLVQLNLKSLYWSDPVSSSGGVLAEDGAVSRTPDRRCPVGGGCGTLTARFRAADRGTAQLTAHRASCGEAMGCRSDERDFTVTIIVAIGQ